MHMLQTMNLTDSHTNKSATSHFPTEAHRFAQYLSVNLKLFER
jgi:hypothetical protein